MFRGRKPIRTRVVSLSNLRQWLSSAGSLLAVTFLLAGCARHTGDFYYVDLSKTPGIEVVHSGRMVLKGLTGDTEMPLISEFRDGTTTIRFEAVMLSYAAELSVVAYDNDGSYFSLSPLRDENQCFFFRPITYDDDRMFKFVWSGCPNSDPASQSSSFSLRIDEGEAADRLYTFQFDIRPNGTWTVYEWPLL